MPAVRPAVHCSAFQYVLVTFDCWSKLGIMPFAPPDMHIIIEFVRKACMHAVGRRGRRDVAPVPRAYVLNVSRASRLATYVRTYVFQETA